MFIVCTGWKNLQIIAQICNVFCNLPNTTQFAKYKFSVTACKCQSAVIVRKPQVENIQGMNDEWEIHGG